MILSIIYMLSATATAWQAQAVLQIQNKQQMILYIEAKNLESKCHEESTYLVFPQSCYQSIKDLLKLGYINTFQANLRESELEKKCSERLVLESDIQRLILLDSHVEPSSKCKSKIEERIKDMLYSQS